MKRFATTRSGNKTNAFVASLPRPSPTAPSCSICDYIAPLYWVVLNGKEQAICARCEQQSVKS